jgi:hypothetical protein
MYSPMTSRSRGGKQIRPQIGDVFQIPLADHVTALGQVLEEHERRTYLVVVFRPGQQQPIDEIIESGFDLAGVVFDAKFLNGDWPIVGHREPVRTAAPWFVNGHKDLGNLRLTNLDHSITRAVEPAEAAAHGTLHLVGPAVLQDAVAATRGISAWREHFDHFRRLAQELSPELDLGEDGTERLAQR